MRADRPFKILVDTRHVHRTEDFRSLEDSFLRRHHLHTENLNLFPQLEAFRNLLDTLIDTLYRDHNVQPHDKVRLVFEHTEFINRAVSTIFMLASELNGNAVMNMAQRFVVSWDAHFRFDPVLRYSFTLARNLNAGGRTNKIRQTTFMLADHLAKRKSVIIIKDNKLHDPKWELCCTRATAVSLSKVINMPRQKSEKNRKSEKKLSSIWHSNHARKLKLILANADGRTGKVFSTAITKYHCQLLVFNSKASFRPIHDCKFWRRWVTILYLARWPNLGFCKENTSAVKFVKNVIIIVLNTNGTCDVRFASKRNARVMERENTAKFADELTGHVDASSCTLTKTHVPHRTKPSVKLGRNVQTAARTLRRRMADLTQIRTTVTQCYAETAKNLYSVFTCATFFVATMHQIMQVNY